MDQADGTEEDEVEKPPYNPGQLESCDDADEDLHLLVVTQVRGTAGGGAAGVNDAGKGTTSLEKNASSAATNDATSAGIDVTTSAGIDVTTSAAKDATISSGEDAKTPTTLRANLGNTQYLATVPVSTCVILTLFSTNQVMQIIIIIGE